MITTRADTNIIRVPNDFPTIQDAINAAQNGSTILVNSGVYNENLMIDKTLMLLGTDKQSTTIDGSVGGARGLAAVNITDADNVVVDGFTVTAGPIGIYLQDANSCLLSGNVVTLNPFGGIQLASSFNNTISDNIVSSNEGGGPGLGFGNGIYLSYSSNNTVSGNILNSDLMDIYLDLGANNNTIFGNVVENGVSLIVLSGQDDTIFGNVFENSSDYPVVLYGSNNTIFENNFMDTPSYRSGSSTANSWSLGGRGNYWDDYTGLDDGSGGRVAGDGVGDTNLPSHGVDYYPLTNPTNPFGILWENEIFSASLVSNSTVSALNFDGADKEVTFSLNSPANATGYFNLSIPTTLLSGPWKVLLDGTIITPEAVIAENQTYTTIYVNYSQTAHTVQIVGTTVLPEYSTVTILSLLALAMLPLLVLADGKRKRNRQTPPSPGASCFS